MRNRLGLRSIACLCVLSLISIAPTLGEEVEVVIENVAPPNGVFLTPFWVGFHEGSFDSYDGGAPAADFPGLEEVAEDGNTGPITDRFAAELPNGVQATIAGPNGPIFPGDVASYRFDVIPSYHRYFSYVSMVIPSNDAFVANGNPVAHRLFDTDGNFTPFEFYILGGPAVNDAGTEVNDEIPENTAALAQAAPNTGVDENGVVTDHPGHQPGGNVLAAVPGGQFIVPGYVIAKVTVRLAPRSETRVYGSGSQQSTPVITDTTLACNLALNSDQDQLQVNCEHDVADPIAMHIHSGARGEDGPVVVDFGEQFTSPVSATFDIDETTAADFLAGNLYLNVHSETYPAGQVRGQIDGCFAGPQSLCLNSDRFQVEASYFTADAGGMGGAIAATADSGQFTFFDEDNVELDVKVLDGCNTNGYFWVFAAGLTDVGVDLTVTDTATGQTQIYTNELGQAFQPILDTEAFISCL